MSAASSEKVVFKITLTSDPKLPYKMNSKIMENLSESIQYFVEQLLPKATVPQFGSDPEFIKKIFQWSKFCESIPAVAKENHCLSQLNVLLERLAQTSNLPQYYCVEFLSTASTNVMDLLLKGNAIEEPLKQTVTRNVILKEVETERLLESCSLLSNHKVAYLDTMLLLETLAGTPSSSIAYARLKASLLRGHCLHLLNSKETDKLDKLLGSLCAANHSRDIFVQLLFQISMHRDNQPSDQSLSSFVNSWLKEIFRRFLMDEKATSCVKVLLYSQKDLRDFWRRDLAMLKLWLETIGVAANLFEPVHNDKGYTWQPRKIESVLVDFSFDELVTVCHCLLEKRDEVRNLTLCFLKEKQKSRDGSLWLDVESSLNSCIDTSKSYI